MSGAVGTCEHLLVVDPSPEARDSISTRLRNSGYQVTSARAGEILEKLDSTGYALIVLDRALSDLQTLKQIRARHPAVLLPVICLTDGTHRLSDVLDAGANDYIARPIDYPVALGRIRTQLDLRATELAAIRNGRTIPDPGHPCAAWPEVLWDWDLTTNRSYFSDRWPGSTDGLLSQLDPEDLPALQAALDAHLAGETPELAAKFRLQPSGIEMSLRARAIRNAFGEALRVTGSLTDLTASKAPDPLTGLPMRQQFVEHLGAMLERTHCGESGPLGVLLIELDSKDTALVAARLEETVQRQDGRWRQQPQLAGGQSLSLARLDDRFAVLIEGLHTTSDAIRVADCLIRDFQELPINVSIGIATYSAAHRTAHDLLRDADTALHRAKGYGGDRWEIFSDEMRVQVVYRLHFENALRRAIEEQEFRVAYQPIVELESRRIVGLEALLRWPTFGLGTCRLEEVIRVAEETGLIVEIGRWVLKEACLQMRQIHQFYPRAPKISLHVNVSEKQFSLDDLNKVVSETLRETGIAPPQLKLEITESALVHQRKEVRDTLQGLKSHGVSLGIDDFGTGYASLSYLHDFPFDTLKLDRGFVSRFGADTDAARAVVHLAHALRMEVVAEGVEDELHAATMLALGCRLGQGYLFAHPMLAHQVLMSVLAKQFG